jgi:hypothetical protein
MDATTAINAIRALTFGKLLCSNSEVTITIQPVCSMLLADTENSNVCYLGTNLGYFFVSRDAGRTTNFIFSRN